MVDVGCVGRGAVGAVVERAARGEGPIASVVRASEGRRISDSLSRRGVGIGTAQDGLDAGGGGGRSRPVAAAGGAGTRSLGRRGTARRDVVREYAVESLAAPDAVL